MHISLDVTLAAVIVGFAVGMTGMGGGALMTPILVLIFGYTPTAAISSDLVAAMVMKPVGSSVHIRRGTVRWELVKWLCLGSVPAAFSGVFILKALGDSQDLEDHIKILLGVTLLVAASAMVAKSWVQGRQTAHLRAQGLEYADPNEDIPIRPIPTVLLGIIGGLLVGMTSVGSGSIIIISLLLLYPRIRGSQLVGTDLVQAVPLVASAAIAHILFGDFQFSLTVSILLGSVPGVYLGARLSSKARDGVIRPAIVFVLVASALKLLNVSTVALAVILVAFALVALPIWGAVDAAGYPDAQWALTGLSRDWWIRVQAFGAPFVVGFAAAVAYFARTRPRLLAAIATQQPPA